MQSVSSNVVFQLSLSLITSHYLYIITVNLCNLFLPMLFFNSHFSNYFTLFVHHYRELVQSVSSNVVFQLSLSLITLPYFYIITVNFGNLFIPMFFIDSYFLSNFTLPYLYIITVNLRNLFIPMFFIHFYFF